MNAKVKNFKKLLIIFACVFALIFKSGCTINLIGDADVINGLTEKKITTALVKIHTTISQNSYAQGSGAIFLKETGATTNNQQVYTYYAITNNHVVYNAFGFSPYKVYDCYGNGFEGQVICKNADYDLAVICFNSTKNYTVLSFANSDASLLDGVIALGNPQGVFNSATLGRVLNYTTVDVDNVSVSECNVTFEVIKHSAPINTGSSGGVILNYDYQICGVNYACILDDKSKEFIEAYAVSVTKVKEFLTLNDIAI